MTIDAGLKESLSQNGGEKFEQVKLAQKEDGAYFYKKTGVTVSTTKGYIYSNNLNPDTKYSYSDDNTFTDTVYNKETKSTEQKVWRWRIFKSSPQRTLLLAQAFRYTWMILAQEGLP